MTDFSKFAWASQVTPRPAPAEDVVYFENGDAAATYVRGQLVECHHPPEVRERLINLLGVRMVQDGAFMKGQSSWGGAAQTLEEAEAFAVDRELKAQRAAALREQAAVMIAEADRIAGGEG